MLLSSLKEDSKHESGKSSETRRYLQAVSNLSATPFLRLFKRKRGFMQIQPHDHWLISLAGGYSSAVLGNGPARLPAFHFLPVCAPHSSRLGLYSASCLCRNVNSFLQGFAWGVLNLAYTLKPKGLPRLHMSPSTLQEIQSLIWGAGGFGVTPVCGQSGESRH